MLLLLVSLGAIIDSVCRIENDKIIKHGKRTTAYVRSVEMHKKPTVPSIEYFYVVNGDTFDYTYFVESIVSFKKLKALEGKTLEVVYDSNAVKRSRLQLNEEAFN